MFIFCLRLGICQVGCNSFERGIFCSKLTKFLLRFVPMTWCTGCVVGEGLVPCLLEWPGPGIQVKTLRQPSSTVAGLQEAGAALTRRAETDDTYYRALVIQRWSTTITMLHVAAHLNHLRSLIGRLHRTNKNLIHR